VKAAAVVVLVIACGLAGCGGGGSKGTATTSVAPGATGNAITIQNFSFSPAVLSSKVGDVVTVTNKDNTAHTFTANNGSFNTGPFSSGSKTVKLTKAGTVSYHCSIHTFMHGTIQVGS
jgi:plastocyanin